MKYGYLKMRRPRYTALPYHLAQPRGALVYSGFLSKAPSGIWTTLYNLLLQIVLELLSYQQANAKIISHRNSLRLLYLTCPIDMAKTTKFNSPFTTSSTAVLPMSFWSERLGGPISRRKSMAISKVYLMGPWSFRSIEFSDTVPKGPTRTSVKVAARHNVWDVDRQRTSRRLPQ